jgi:hypothetical protein
MYNPATQVQVSTDANLGSYFQKKQNRYRGFPYRISFQKKEILEQLRHMIGPTYLEDQNLGRHRELKYGGTMMVPTLASAGELAVQAHIFDRCSVEEPLLYGVELHLHH